MVELRVVKLEEGLNLNSPEFFEINRVIDDVLRYLSIDKNNSRITVKINVSGEILLDGDEAELSKKIPVSLLLEMSYNNLKNHVKTNKLIPKRYQLNLQLDEENYWKLVKKKNEDETIWVLQKTVDGKKIEKILEK